MRDEAATQRNEEKLLPQNMDAETGVLGSLLIDPDAITQVLDFLRPDDFYREAHRATYAAMVDLHEHGSPADLITLTDELERRGKLEDVGGQSFISSLANQVPTSANIEHYARIVERTAILRRLIHAAGQIAAVAYNEPEGVVAIDQAEALVAAVRASFKERNMPIIAQGSTDLLRKEIAPPNWAVPDLFAEGLTLFAGKVKKGKSTLALGVLLAIAWGGMALGKIPVAQGEALYLALEDNERRMQRRLLRMLDYSDEWPPDGFLHFTYNWPKLDNGGIDKLDQWMNQHPRTRIIVIDTFKRVKPRQQNKNATLYDTDYESLLPLQTWASARHVAVVVIAHVRKSGADDVVDEISGSTGLTGVADNIVVLRQTPDYTELHRHGRDYSDDTVWALKGDVDTLRWTIQGPLLEARRSEERQAIIDTLATVGHGLTPAQIAAMLHKPPANIRHMLHKMTDSGDTAIDYDQASKLYILPPESPSSLSSLSLREVTVVKEVTEVIGVTGVTVGDKETVTPVTSVTPLPRDPSRARAKAASIVIQCPRRELGNPHNFTFKDKRAMVRRCEFCGCQENSLGANSHGKTMPMHD